MIEVRKLIESRLPGLHGRIEALLVESETAYTARSNQPPSDFLLQHTRRTAAIAYALARAEGVDPLLPTLVALYHDAGKFHGGTYHEDDVPEEEHAAVIAERMLGDHGLPPDDVASVLGALRALYDTRYACDATGRIVQDADRLEKLGYLGIGAFFTKAALRGRGLVEALTHSLSRELTYALAAPHSMLTASGRRLAREQGAKSVAFFDDLLRDLAAWGIASFERRVVVLEEEFVTRDGSALPRLEVTLVAPRACPECDAPVTVNHWRAQGIKCEQLHASFACSDCGHGLETHFCLPIVVRAADVPTPGESSG